MSGITMERSMRSKLIVLLILGNFLVSACTLMDGGGESTALPTSSVGQTSIPASPTIDGPVLETPPLEVTTEPELTETVSLPPIATIAPTPQFVVQPGTPVGTVNIIKPDLSCDWMGIGGQVFGPGGVPVDSLIVEVGGNIVGNEISQLAITGNASIFGPGGYLVELGEVPIASEGTLWIQLFSEGDPQSEKIYLTTYAECDRNLLIVNFMDSSSMADVQIRLPVIIK